MKLQRLQPALIRLLSISVVFVCVAFVFLSSPVSVEAKSFYYPNYDVTIDINKDSTFDVTEKLTYRFTGEFQGVIAQIKLSDPVRDRRYCTSNDYTCGGIGRIALVGVYDGDGKQVDPSKYQLYTEKDEDTEIEYFTIKWEVWPGGKNFSGTGEDFTWSFKYRLYDTLGWIGNNAKQPYLYWNALAEERGGEIEKGQVIINFPNDVKPLTNTLEVLTDYFVKYSVKASGNKLTVDVSDVSASGNFTVAYGLPIGSIIVPGSIKYSASLPWIVGVKLDGIDLGNNLGGQLNGIPVGERELEFYFPGYESKTMKVDVASGMVTEVNVNLQPSAFMMIILAVNIILNVIGVIIIPVGLVRIYLHWRTKGRDVNMPQTIIPLYHPPKDVRPYLLGSLKDEQVDQRDVTGSIIDLAYRGFIKIKEVTKGKDYLLTKLEGKADDPGLDPIEVELMDMIFGAKTEVETKDLGMTFLLKYKAFTTRVYKELVDRKYFDESPEKTRTRYAGCGVALFITFLFLAFVLGFAALPVIGVVGPFFFALAIAVIGLGLTIVAKFMPAKTALGSKIFAEVLGFRMYLYTAERYRLQGLKPEEFERYLSYAIVFEIEKEWADKFKDIYKGQPEWLEGDSNVLWDAYWISQFSRSFSDGVVQNVFQSSTGSSTGSGWSGGGGSFGGFSGGGGGGGGRGAF